MRLLIVAAVGAALTAAPAWAGPIPSGGLTGQDVVRWLQDAGYKADLGTSDNGNAYIDSSAEGANFTIYMYDCKDGRCASMQFDAGFDMTGGLSASRANQWNREQRYSRLYLDDESDPHLQYDANLSPGGTYEALDDDFGVWRASLENFIEFIDW